MIVSFGCKLTEKLFNNYKVNKFGEIQKRARIKLKYLHSAANIEDLKTPPSNNLELLKGKRKNYYSIRINIQFRIIFIWKDNHAHEVQIVDYH